MELIIYQHPCWLLEAAELVHGLVNHTPAGTMVGEGLYCIPKDRLRSIQASACSGMDPGIPGFGSISRMCPWKGSAAAAPAWVAPCFTAI